MKTTRQRQHAAKDTLWVKKKIKKQVIQQDAEEKTLTKEKVAFALTSVIYSELPPSGRFFNEPRQQEAGQVVGGRGGVHSPIRQGGPMLPWGPVSSPGRGVQWGFISTLQAGASALRSSWGSIPLIRLGCSQASIG